MSNEELIINDDLLDEVYLAKKRLGDRKPLFNTSSESYYQLDDHIILCTPLDPNNSSFRMFNGKYRKTNLEPLLEIFVDPVKTSIEFVSTLNNRSKTRIMVTFDHLEKNWDVRSYINGENKVSTLKNSLEELWTLPVYQEEEYTGFIRLLEVAKQLNKRKNVKQLLHE